jgi:hypothetical protein
MKLSIEEGFRLLRLNTDAAYEEANRLARNAAIDQDIPVERVEWTETSTKSSPGEQNARLVSDSQ